MKTESAVELLKECLSVFEGMVMDECTCGVVDGYVCDKCRATNLTDPIRREIEELTKSEPESDPNKLLFQRAIEFAKTDAVRHKSPMVVFKNLDCDWEYADFPYHDVSIDCISAIVDSDGQVYMRPAVTDKPARPFSVLLLYPDYLASSYGSTTHFSSVWGESPGHAVKRAQFDLVLENLRQAIFPPDDFRCLLCIPGEHLDLKDSD